MALLKAHEPPNQLGWLAADWMANNVCEMADPLALSNLHSDSMALEKTQQKLQHNIVQPSGCVMAKAIAMDDCNASGGVH